MFAMHDTSLESRMSQCGWGEAKSASERAHSVKEAQATSTTDATTDTRKLPWWMGWDAGVRGPPTQAPKVVEEGMQGQKGTLSTASTLASSTPVEGNTLPQGSEAQQPLPNADMDSGSDSEDEDLKLARALVEDAAPQSGADGQDKRPARPHVLHLENVIPQQEPTRAGQERKEQSGSNRGQQSSSGRGGRWPSNVSTQEPGHSRSNTSKSVEHLDPLASPQAAGRSSRWPTSSSVEGVPMRYRTSDFVDQMSVMSSPAAGSLTDERREYQALQNSLRQECGNPQEIGGHYMYPEDCHYSQDYSDAMGCHGEPSPNSVLHSLMHEDYSGHMHYDPYGQYDAVGYSSAGYMYEDASAPSAASQTYYGGHQCGGEEQYHVHSHSLPVESSERVMDTSRECENAQSSETVSAATPSSAQAGRKRRAFGPRLFCHIYLHMIQPGFDLIPRLIGHHGNNMRKIAASTEAKIRIRGRGSGHLESHGEEANTPLMVAVTVDRNNADGFRKAVAMTIQTLQGVVPKYENYCKKHGCNHVGPHYSIGHIPSGVEQLLGDVIQEVPRHR